MSLQSRIFDKSQLFCILLQVSSVERFEMSGSIRINGVSVVGGRSLSIINGKVLVDGRDVTPENQKQISIEVTGNVDNIEADVCEKITVTGTAGNIKTSQGDIDVGGDAHGKVSTSQGNIDIGGSVTGDVATSQGNIKVKGAVSGNASTTMGNVIHGT